MRDYSVSYLRGGSNLRDAFKDLPFRIVDSRSGVLGVVVSELELKELRDKNVVKKVRKRGDRG